MARSAGRSERTSALIMAAGSLFAIVHTAITERAGQLAFGMTVWSAVLALLVVQYRLLGREGFYGSALYHRLLICMATLIWLPFAVTFAKDLAADRSVSPWAIILLCWVALTMWSGWCQYRTTRTVEAARR